MNLIYFSAYLPYCVCFEIFLQLRSARFCFGKGSHTSRFGDVLAIHSCIFHRIYIGWTSIGDSKQKLIPQQCLMLAPSCVNPKRFCEQRFHCEGIFSCAFAERVVFELFGYNVDTKLLVKWFFFFLVFGFMFLLRECIMFRNLEISN